jgi:two-component system, OmpR family, response regulator
VVIDVSLGAEPEGGFELCRELRTRAPRLPLIFLTARDSDFDAVSGLRLGADDYLTKDISLPHLLARVAALFRRMQALAEPANAGAPWSAASCSLDPERLEARWDGRDPGLTLTEFWIVHALARTPAT